jgi:hypothetical protein
VSEFAVNRQRAARTQQEIAQLRSEIGTWLALRANRDKRKQYVTQLGVLKGQLDHMLGEVERQVGDIRVAAPRWQVYSDFRKCDRRVLWVRRLWDYFRTKFDQRDDEQLAPILQAADEVVWSCYSQPFRILGTPQHSAPLPFIAAYYSPNAVPREEPPQDLRSEVDAEFLKAMLNEMPVPVVAIPPACVAEPWLLVYLAHEVGHHVQFDLLGDGRLIDSFGEMLFAAGGTRWKQRGTELFADIFSLAAVGHWALWALSDLLWGEAASMLDDSNPRYPSALVRLQFMKEVANGMGLDGGQALRGMCSADFLDSGPVVVKSRDLRQSAREDLSTIEKIAQAALGPIPGARPITELVDFKQADFRPPRGLAHLWAQVLSGRALMTPQKQLRSARMVLAGAVEAWAGAPPEDDAEQARVADLLKRNLADCIVENREEITRESSQPSPLDLEAKNDQLTRLLMSAEATRDWI